MEILADFGAGITGQASRVTVQLKVRNVPEILAMSQWRELWFVRRDAQ